LELLSVDFSMLCVSKIETITQHRYKLIHAVIENEIKVIIINSIIILYLFLNNIIIIKRTLYLYVLSTNIVITVCNNVTQITNYCKNITFAVTL